MATSTQLIPTTSRVAKDPATTPSMFQSRPFFAPENSLEGQASTVTETQSNALSAAPFDLTNISAEGIPAYPVENRVGEQGELGGAGNLSPFQSRIRDQLISENSGDRPASAIESAEPLEQEQEQEQEQELIAKEISDLQAAEAANQSEQEDANNANQFNKATVDTKAIANLESPPAKQKQTLEQPNTELEPDPAIAETEAADPESEEQSEEEQNASPESEQGSASGANGGDAAGGSASGSSGEGAPNQGEGTPATSGNGQGDAGNQAAAAMPQTAAASGTPAPSSPDADPGFQAVVAQVGTVAAGEKQHGSAESEAQAAQAAAVSPESEIYSQAQGQQVEAMDAEEPGEFDGEAFKAAVLEQLEAVMPENEEEAEEFSDSNQVDTVRDAVATDVATAQEGAAAPIAERAEEEPDTSGIVAREAVALEPPAIGELPGEIDASQAAPQPRSEGEVSGPLQESSQSLDQQMADANITEEQLQNANEPQFTEALGARQEAQAHAATAPDAYRAQESGILSQAQGNAQAVVTEQTQGMHGQREQIFSQVTGAQENTRGQDEQQRSQVADHINGLYEGVRTQVEDCLSGLEAEVVELFTTAADNAKQIFEDYVEEKMDAYKEERYGEWYEVGGLVRRMGDAVMGLPPEVNEFFVEGRERYIEAIDAPLTEISNLVAARLQEAKGYVTQGRQDIQTYVESLPEDLRQIGEAAAQEVQGRFDELEQSIDAQRDALVSTIVTQYQENLQAVDARIEEMQAQNSGLVARAFNAIAGTIQTVLAMKARLMEVLNGAMDVITTIIADPIGFLGNLVDGISQGMNNFGNNIAEHLQNGLLAWLTGALGPMGITLPEDIFSLPGIFDLVTQVLGLTWDYVRGKAVGMFGEPVVGAMEQGVEMIQVIRQEGIAGLWEQVQEDFADLQTSVIGQIKEMVITQVITAGIRWILSLLNPASAFVRACIAIYDIVRFFINQGSQIMELVQAVIDSVSAIASGSVGGAAEMVEQALARAVPVAIGFLASLLGISGLARRVQRIVERIRERIDRAIDRLLERARELAAGLLRRLGIGGNSDEEEETAENGELEDSEVGETINFTAGDESHRLWIVTQGSSVEVMVASTPMAVEAKLNEWQGRLDSLSEEDQARAQSLMTTAQQQLGTTEQSAETTVREMAEAEQEGATEADINEAENADNRTETEQSTLSTTLQELFEIFGEGDMFEEWWNEEVEFTNEAGEDHRLFFEGEAESAEVMMASHNPAPLEEYLNRQQETADESQQQIITQIRSELSSLQTITRSNVTRGEARNIVVQLTRLSSLLSQLGDEEVKPLEVNWSHGGGANKYAAVEQLSYDTSRGGSVPRYESDAWKLIQDAGLSRRYWVRMHMITEGVGGEGTDENLVPAPKSVNSGAQVRSFEIAVENLLSASSSGSNGNSESNGRRPNAVWIKTQVTFHGGGTATIRGQSENYGDTDFINSVHMEAGLHFFENGEWEKDEQPRILEDVSNIPLPDFSQSGYININENVSANRIASTTDCSQYFAEHLLEVRRNLQDGFSSMDDLDTQMTIYWQGRLRAREDALNSNLSSIWEVYRQGKLGFSTPTT